MTLPTETFEAETNYLMEFDMTLTEGTLNTFGAHSLFRLDEAFINDVRVGSMYKGFKYNYALNEKIHLKIVFSDYTRPHGDTKLFLQPNRLLYNTDNTVKFENISIRKVL